MRIHNTIKLIALILLFANSAYSKNPQNAGGIYTSPANIQQKVVQYKAERDKIKEDLLEIKKLLDLSADASTKEKQALEQAAPVIDAFIDGTTECKIEEAKLTTSFSDRMHDNEIVDRINQQVSECYTQVQEDAIKFETVIQHLRWLKIEAQTWLDNEIFVGAESDRLSSRLDKIQKLIDFWKSQQ